LIKNSQPFGNKFQKTAGGIFRLTLYKNALLYWRDNEAKFLMPTSHKLG